MDKNKLLWEGIERLLAKHILGFFDDELFVEHLDIENRTTYKNEGVDDEDLKKITEGIFRIIIEKWNG